MRTNERLSLSHRKYVDEAPLLAGEVWKEIPDWPGFHVSSLGRIKDEGGIRKLAGGTLATKHRYSTIRIGNRAWTTTVAAFMLHTFVGPAPPDKPLARHLDDDPTNDTLANLAWGSKKDNYLDALRNGRVNHQALGPLISAAKKGKRLGVSPANKGVPRSSESIKAVADKLRGRIVITNGTTERRISPTDTIPNDWYRGRSSQILAKIHAARWEK